MVAIEFTIQCFADVENVTSHEQLSRKVRKACWPKYASENEKMLNTVFSFQDQMEFYSLTIP